VVLLVCTAEAVAPVPSATEFAKLTEVLAPIAIDLAAVVVADIPIPIELEPET